MNTTDTGPESGFYKLFNVGVAEFATEGYTAQDAKEPSVVMVSVEQDKWGVTKLRDGKYTIKAPCGKFAFVQDPKEDEIVELRSTPEYEWFIVIVSWTKNYHPVCRIYTESSDKEKLYWRAKLQDGKFAGVVYLSKETDEKTEWIFDNSVGTQAEA